MSRSSTNNSRTHPAFRIDESTTKPIRNALWDTAHSQTVCCKQKK